MNEGVPARGKFECLKTAWMLAVCMASLTLAAPAHAETRSEVGVSLAPSYDSNPFLGIGGGRGAASIRFEIRPEISQVDEVSSFRILGRLEHVEYLQFYDSAQNLSAGLSARHRLSPKVQIAANAGISSNVSTAGIGAILTGGTLSPVEGEPLPLPQGEDITFLGERQRRNSVTLDASVRYTPSAVEEFGWQGSVELQRYPSARLTSSDTMAQRLFYSRQVNADLSLGASIQASASNFGDGLGNARVISPQMTARLKIDPRLELVGAAGFSHTRIETPQGRQNANSVSGQASLCHKGLRSQFCLDAARQVFPSAIGGVRTQSTLGASYAFRLSEREDLRLNGSYSRASAPIAGAIVPGGRGDVESVRGFVRYERRLEKNLRLFVSGGYTDTRDDLRARRSNVSGTVGITFDFGGRS